VEERREVPERFTGKVKLHRRSDNLRRCPHALEAQVNRKVAVTVLAVKFLNLAAALVVPYAVFDYVL
jgi:hypothetical protein